MPRNQVISPIPQWSKKKILKDSIAELPQNQKAPEIESFNLSFTSYRDDLNEVDSLNQNCAHHVIHDLRTIGKCFDFQSLKSNGIDIIPVQKAGAYKVLFNKLTNDIDVKEHKVHSDSRIFYYIVQKKCFIVAITNSHFETDKNR